MQSNENGSTVFLHIFTVDAADEEAILAVWSHNADFMRLQHAYISTQLHKAVERPLFLHPTIPTEGIKETSCQLKVRLHTTEQLL